LLGAEGIAVGIAARRELAGGYELSRALHGIMPTALTAAAPVALGGALLLLGLRLPNRAVARLGVAFVGLVLGLVEGFGISTGRWIAGSGRP